MPMRVADERGKEKGLADGIPGRRIRRRASALVLPLVLACLSVPTWGAVAGGGPRVTREYDLKAAFLFNFAQFVDWPPEAFANDRAPFVIGVVGEDPFGRSLDEIVAGESVREHPIVVRRFPTLHDLGPCHMLFVGRPDAARPWEVAEALRGRTVLTVGDAKGFASHGGAIEFVVVGGRLRLIVNVAEARAAKLTISSKLLRQSELVGAAP